MKRFVAAVTAGSVAIAAGLLSSAALGLPAGGVGAPGAQSVAASGCDRDGVRTTLRTAFEAAAGYTVTAVVVDGIDGPCAGHQLSVAIADAAGRTAVQGGPLPVPVGGGVVVVPVPPIPVESAARVHTLLD